MSISFKDYLLLEKLILYNQGKRYGQIVFLVGGAGSGKNFAADKFMQGADFKMYDVDEFKTAFLKLAATTNRYPEIQNLNLKNPEDVSRLHMFIKGKGTDLRILNLLIASKRNPEVLPNILINMTGKDMKQLREHIPTLLNTGYKPQNIHITWVLTNYHVAVSRNSTRSRVVHDDILLKTHEGASLTMYDVLAGTLPRGLDGEVRIILNNSDQTKWYTDKDGRVILNSKGQPTPRDFTYIKVKDSGKPVDDPRKFAIRVLHWFRENIPMTDDTEFLWSAKSFR